MISTPDTMRAATHEVQQPLPASPAPAVDVQQPALEAALREIRWDCLVQPLLYLDEVYVPFGGE